jgi:hypothetical protein
MIEKSYLASDKYISKILYNLVQTHIRMDAWIEEYKYVNAAILTSRLVTEFFLILANAATLRHAQGDSVRTATLS